MDEPLAVYIAEADVWELGLQDRDVGARVAGV